MIDITTEVELAKVVLNAGSFGLNVLIILMLYRLVHRWAGALVGAIHGATEAFAALAEKIDSLSRKPDKPESPASRKPREKTS